jgi:F420-non-reducing hydrogenase iron-sulfur subunit
MEKSDFQPRILAFCCHYCAYAAADLAGTMRIQYPPNIRIIRTPCTGRLETEFLIKAFETGADGVLVAGCLEGGCHYTSGNLYAKRRVEYMRDMLEEMGLEKERLRMVNISAAWPGLCRTPSPTWSKPFANLGRALSPATATKAALVPKS